MAFTNLAVFGGAFFTPILVGKITHTLMWWWTFYLVAIFCGACLPLIYFFCPETAYRRDASLNTDMLATGTSRTALNEKDQQPESAELHERGTSSDKAVAGPECTTAEVPKKHSFRQSLAVFTGRKSDETFWKLLFRPFPLFLQPAFVWACLVQGTMIGWTVFIGVIMAQFFLGYPLWWDEVRSGYAYVGAFIGAILGFVIAGGLADWSAKKLTQWNKGVYEPEFRILLVVPQMIFGCMGLYGFGITADGLLVNKYHYTIPLMFFAFEVAGMVIGAVASSLYIVDAYRDLAIEGFTCMIIFKNLFSFGLTFKAYDWLVANQTNATPVFNPIASVQVVICLTSIPLCEFSLSFAASVSCRVMSLTPFFSQTSTANVSAATSIDTTCWPCLVSGNTKARFINWRLCGVLDHTLATNIHRTLMWFSHKSRHLALSGKNLAVHFHR